MCKKKTDGGMGFKDFQNFNMALLGKQCWKMLTEPNEFWVKLLKGIYFPNTSFWKASRGARASWAWHSLIEGRKMLEGNVLWQIGDGKKVDIWDDP